ncbi:PASTA domain-containing protein [bacterium]|nr:PASTA domain-containing protein [bacterium]NUN46797.1 PASTA domain-containing protein [bacterium]
MRRLFYSAFYFCVIVLFFVLLLDKWLMPMYVDLGKDIAVPAVTGLSSEMAQKKLSELGFSVVLKRRYDISVAPNTVIQQSPEAQALVKAGRQIHLVIADDNQTVIMPSLTLSTYRDAVFNLQSIGLAIGVLDSASSNEFPQGVILKQSIEPNTVVRLGQSVDLTISLGNNITESKVPFLINLSLKDATARISDSGLRLGKIERKFLPDLIPDTVVGQSLDSSLVVTPLTIIDLTVSSTDSEL